MEIAFHKAHDRYQHPTGVNSEVFGPTFAAAIAHMTMFAAKKGTPRSVALR